MILYICVYLKKVYDMTITVGGITAPQGTNPTTGSSSPVGEEDPLFGNVGETGSVDNTENSEEIALLEAELSQLKNQLSQLEAQRAEKVAYQKELEAQKRALNNQIKTIEAQIAANEEKIKQNNEVIAQNEQNIEKAQKEIEELQKEYDAKNKEAQELSEEISERISKIIEDSENGVKAQKEKVKEALDEANAKVKSGEITEDEVAQYVINKVGGVSITASTQELASINSMNAQVRALISDAVSVSDKISVKQSEIETYQANISSAIQTNIDLQNQNEPLKTQVASLTEQVNDIDTEIDNTGKEINSIDKNIAQVQTNIQSVENQISVLKGGESQEVTVITVGDYESQSTDRTGANNISDSKSTVTAITTNPFLAISYDTGVYASMTEALEAMATNNERRIAAAQAQLQNNEQELRKLFQDYIA